MNCRSTPAKTSRSSNAEEDLFVDGFAPVPVSVPDPVPVVLVQVFAVASCVNPSMQDSHLSAPAAEQVLQLEAQS